MGIRPIDLEFFNKEGRNVHESIVAASKRARQINEDLKIEFNQRVEILTVKPESETEENDVNPDQLKISLEFEKREKPTDVALRELIDGKLEWEYKEREVAPAVQEEEEEQEEELGPDLQVFTTRGQALLLSRQAEAAVTGGRPACPNCGEPIDDFGHFCLPASVRWKSDDRWQ